MALIKLGLSYVRMFKLIQSADHISKLTGASPTVNISKAGAAFGVAAGVVSEVGSGWYKVVLTVADNNTLGDLAYYITAASADDTDFVDQVVAFDPNDDVRIGLRALPTAAAEAPGGLFTRGTGAGQINQSANGQIDVSVKSYITNQDPATLLFAAVVETGFTFKQCFRIIASIVAGKETVTPTTDTFRSLDDSRNCVIGTVDASGNRTAVTFNA